MTFDVFSLRDRVVREYRHYFESFINVLDPRIEEFVEEELRKGTLWPDAFLQLNPAYERTSTLGELTDQRVIRPETGRFFGPELRLYRHQEQAVRAAQRGDSYLVSTGTGSGKSLTYLVPIFTHVLRHEPERHGVRALLIYPMNALINSQHEALNANLKRWPEAPVRFAQYTGQEGDEQRRAILDDPPHVLLTNYVMLEYLLIRPDKRSLLREATRDLRFIVVDELHV